MPPQRRHHSPVSATSTSTPQGGQTRDYSCISCKKRKSRCDRQNPCSKCVELGLECVPGVRAPYSRRRTNRHDGGTPASLPRQADDAQKKPTPKSTPNFGQNLWHGLSDEFTPEPTEKAESITNESPFLDPIDLVLPGSMGGEVDLVHLYPSANHAFLLWQKFLENVNPLSKIIHAPSIQPEVIKVSTDLSSASYASLALLFSIYAAAVMSLTKTEVESLFGETKKALQHKFTSGAQRAFALAGFMKVANMTLLQAFTIYLLATRQLDNSETMWYLTGLAVRMGQSLRLHENGSTSIISVFDMQMRRRLWWQILFIDGRAAQLAHSPGPIFSPDLDFTLPSNLNDADLSPSMTAQPICHEGPTEMLFCLLRYEIGRFLNEQGSSLHSPSVSIVEKDRLIDKFEEHVERTYLRFCDPALPLHLMASGGARSAICKMRLMVHHPSQHAKDTSLSASEKSNIFNWSVKMVEYDVLGQSTQLLKPFGWHLDAYFQLDAFVFLLIMLQTVPPGPLVDKAWDLVSETYKYRQFLMNSNNLHKQIRKLTLKSWEASQLNRVHHGFSVWNTPQIIKQLLCSDADGGQQSNGTEGVQERGETNKVRCTPNNDSMDSLNGSYSESMPLGSELPGSEISDWEYWDQLLRDYNPEQLVG